MILLLSGGVGGSKLAKGFSGAVRAENLRVVVNIGDDFELYGLSISPDVDIMLYNLAGIADQIQGWGVADDTLSVHNQLLGYDKNTWFTLGDRDLAAQLFRTKLLKEGRNLSEITGLIAKTLGVNVCVAPMSDEKVETRILTGEEDIHFEEYFVQRGARDPVDKIYFKGIEKAKPSEKFSEGLKQAEAVIICPSNPLVSIGPILAIPGVKDKLKDLLVPKVAVSPIIGGEVIKGPLALMFKSLGIEPSAYSVARFYQGIIDTFVIDKRDIRLKNRIESELNIKVLVTNILMTTEEEKIRLAKFLLKQLSINSF